MATVNTRATTQWNPFWERGLGPIDVLGRIVLFATSALRAMPRSLRYTQEVWWYAAFLAISSTPVALVITYFSAQKSTGSSAYFAAGRRITGWQNGLAVAGDYMSAASFLGIAGMIAFNGYDGFMYSVGWLVAYLTVLFLIAEPMRNTGKYTMVPYLGYQTAERILGIS